MSHRVERRINELKCAIEGYCPGSTFRVARDRPTEPPPVLRIGLFGPTGVGKSALINSISFATGTMWESRAPEGFAGEASKTLARNAYPMTEGITVIDNRGMTSFGGPFMAELGHQLAGVHNDDQDVQWNIHYLRRLVAGLERTFRAKKECEIHCAVLVISALNLSLRATDLTDLIDQIKKMTGFPPIVVITHRRHPKVREEIIASFRTGLQQQRIDYVYELENYTTTDHEYNADKHLVLLEAIHQCTMVGDRVIKHKETDQESCVIL